MGKATDMEEKYPTSSDLSEHFPPHPTHNVPLPANFDSKCKCGKELKRSCETHRTKRRPFAVFRCSWCDHAVYLFEAPRFPFILSHEELLRSVDPTHFSESIDRLIKRREEKHHLNEQRAKQYEPTAP